MTADTPAKPSCICMQAKALGMTQTASIHNMGMKRLYALIRACHPEIIRARNKYTQRKDVDVEKCAKLLNQGYTLALLSTETGISVTILRSTLADAGVYKIRTPPTSVEKKQMVRAPRSLPYSSRLTVASSQKWQCKRCDEPLSSRFDSWDMPNQSKRNDTGELRKKSYVLCT